jgi:uncharacterized repeat protein (TIGR01451 family)
MNMNRKSVFNRSGKFLPGAALALAAAAFAPSAVFASTAASTTIRNTASVAFNDAGNNPQTAVTAFVDVTVLLVPSAPNVSTPAATSINQGQSASLTYFVTGTANGLDTYTMSLGDTLTNLSGVTLPTLSNISLGGTTLASALVTGSTSITVPWDGQASGALNGLIGGGAGVGSVISIGGVIYTINTIDRSASTLANNVAIINLTSAITAGTSLAVGNVIGEQKQVVVSIPSGTVTGAGSSGTDVVVLTVASTSGAKPSTNSGNTTITVNRPTLTVTKLVSTDNGVGGVFAAGTTAVPGTVLVYRIVANNTGASSASAVAFTDVLPQFVTYVAGSGKFATATAASVTLTSPTYSSGTTLTDASALDDGYTFTAATNTVLYNPGGATGTVAAGSVLVLFFKVTIN